jgi:hypothetical protein
MKPTLVMLVGSVLLAAAVTAGTAGANGSPYSPGLVAGWSGVGTGDGVRLVAFGMPKSTVVAAVRTRDGHVLRSSVVQGFYGVPLVAYDGTPGGLSGDGRRLVLSAYGPVPGARGRTRFLVLRTSTLRPRARVVLRGSWSFDAVAPDGSTLYLTQHLRAGEHPLYRVRTYDLTTRTLGGAVVDRLEGERDMGGEPLTRASSPDGRWAYTLYARKRHDAFVHALDTEKREAFCIDLPLGLGYQRQWELRLRLRERGERLAVTRGTTTLASVDTDSWKVEVEGS